MKEPEWRRAATLHPVRSENEKGGRKQRRSREMRDRFSWLGDGMNGADVEEDKKSQEEGGRHEKTASVKGGWLKRSQSLGGAARQEPQKSGNRTQGLNEIRNGGGQRGRRSGEAGK